MYGHFLCCLFKLKTFSKWWNPLKEPDSFPFPWSPNSPPSSTGWDGSLPFSRLWLLWYGQAPPAPRRKPWAAWSERAETHRHGERGHASPGTGAPADPPDAERARCPRLGQQRAVGWSRSDVLALGRVTRTAWKKRLLLRDSWAPGYDPASTEVSLPEHVLVASDCDFHSLSHTDTSWGSSKDQCAQQWFQNDLQSGLFVIVLAFLDNLKWKL